MASDPSLGEGGVLTSQPLYLSPAALTSFPDLTLLSADGSASFRLNRLALAAAAARAPFRAALLEAEADEEASVTSELSALDLEAAYHLMVHGVCRGDGVDVDAVFGAFGFDATVVKLERSGRVELII